MRETLAHKLINVIHKAILSVDRPIKIWNPEIKETETHLNVEVLVDGSRFGDTRFFEPRWNEEDDDYPNFIGADGIFSYLKKRLGSRCRIDVYDHEKGLFTVAVRVEKLNMEMLNG